MLDTSRFHAGANLPWIRYGCDFGANAWQPHGGLAARGVPDDVKRVLARMGQANAPLLRWFLFTDGRAGIRFNGEEPVGLDARVLDDVSVALTVANDTGTRLVFTLFDFHWCHAASFVNGVQLGGHARVFAKSALRVALVETVLTPLFREFGDRPEIAAWDVINEPEWVTGRVRTWRPWAPVGRGDMRRTITAVADLAHTLSPHPVTVGLASRRWLFLVDGIPLDFHQVHWYDRIDGDTPPDSSAGTIHTVPIMLGEFPSLQSPHSPAALLEMAERGGYFAALPWSLFAEDRCSGGGDALCQVFEARAERTAPAPRPV